MRAVFLFALFADVVCSQPSARYVEIKLPRSVDSAKVFIRYLLDAGASPIGGWVDPRREVSSYFIATTQAGKEAARFRALVYAPGCAIQTYDLFLSGSSVQPIEFDCRAVPSKWMTGVVAGLIDSQITAKYRAKWIQDFFGLGVETLIPVSQENYQTDAGRFHILLPDFLDEGLYGELQFWVTDLATGKVIARLLPDANARARSAMPDEIKFRICGTHESRGHDRFGFAIRGQEQLDCEGLLDH